MKIKTKSKFNKLTILPIVITVSIAGIYRNANRNSKNSVHLVVLLIAFLCAFLLLLQYLSLYYIKLKKRASFKNSGINIVDKMNGQEFEEFLLIHFKNLGYKGHMTATTGDYGADLVLSKDKERIVVQAKRWRKKVGIEAIQQVIGAKLYYKADRNIVITNSYFTPNAKELANRSSVELWDRNKLLDIMAKSNGKDIAKQTSIYCEKCGAPMVLRHGKNNDFYGCRNYPKCTYTKSKYY